MSKIIIAIVTIAVMGFGVFTFTKNRQEEQPVHTPATTTPTTTDTTENAEDNQTETTSQNQVTIENLSFNSSDITVKKGTTVTWTNQDSIAHNVVSSGGGPLGSKLLNQGESYSFTFNETGTFNYFCEPHPQMTGTVTVTE